VLKDSSISFNMIEQLDSLSHVLLFSSKHLLLSKTSRWSK